MRFLRNLRDFAKQIWISEHKNDINMSFFCVQKAAETEVK